MIVISKRLKFKWRVTQYLNFKDRTIPENTAFKKKKIGVSFLA
jgi:hypothetical protein